MLNINKSEALLASIRNGETLTQRDKLSLIISLSLPSMLAQITSVLMFYIDAAMVGRLGAQASASIGLVESTTWLFGSITNAASLGFSVQIAHSIGANDFARARRLFRHGLIATTVLSVALCLGVMLISHPLPYWLGGKADIAGDASLYVMIFSFALPFMQLSNLCNAALKSSGDMRIPSIVSVMMCVLDVMFNYFFIFICRLGVAGAALGTLSAIIASSSLSAYIAIFRNKILRLKQDTKAFQWINDYIRNALKIASPMTMQSILMGGAQIVSTIIVAPLGNFAIAANTFAITAESLCYMPGYGIGDAATTLVGQSNGAGRYDVCKSFARMTVFLGMAVMAVMGLIMYIFAPEMIGMLTPVEEIRQLGSTALRIEAFAEPMFAASIVAYSVCVGAGDTFKPALMNLGSIWAVRLTLAALLAPRYGLPGVWMAMAIELTFRGTIFLIRLFNGKWIKLNK